MSKRFHDTDIWDEDWFLAFTAHEKMFWFWVCDKCNHAGIWRVNMRLFEIHAGCKIDTKSFLRSANCGKERIRVLDGGRWLLLGFIAFQYQTGILATRNAAHRGALKCLAANGIIPESIGYRVDTTKPLGISSPPPTETEAETDTDKSCIAGISSLGIGAGKGITGLTRIGDAAAEAVAARAKQ